MRSRAYGHKNITGKHKNTLEITKDPGLSIQGDCIIGVKSDFDLSEIKKMMKGKKYLRMELSVESISEEVNAELNPDFDDDHEIVLRRSDFKSKRTLGIRADKACNDLSREFVEKLKNDKAELNIKMEFY